MSTEDKKEWSKPVPKQPGGVTRPGEVAVRFAGKLWFVNDAGGRYDGLAAKLFTDFESGTNRATIDVQLNEWAIANPDANIVHMQPMGENALLILWQYRRTSEELEELDWVDNKVHEFLEEARRQRYETEAASKQAAEEQEVANAFFQKLGKELHESKVLTKALEKGLGGEKKDELLALHKALHNGSLFVALGVEVPEHLKPKEPAKVIELPAGPVTPEPAP
jgi:hypothetical protein